MSAGNDNVPAVLSDRPDIGDKLDFVPYANTVRDIILNPRVETPLTIGIFGSWGSGKTSLMKMIEARIGTAAMESGARQNYVIWFNAWLYSKEDSLWRALIAQVLAGVGKLRGETPEVRKDLEQARAQLYRTAGPGELGTFSIAASDLLRQQGSPGSSQFSLNLPEGLDVAEQVAGDPAADPAEALRRLREQMSQAMAAQEQARIESLERFQRQFRSLVEKHVIPYGYLVVFVDDLDRCLPEKAIEVLEAIKLFLDEAGCIFILGIDQAVIERGIRLRYGETGGRAGDAANEGDLIDGRRYLEKIIQIPFSLPPISPDAMGRFIYAIAPDLPHQECGSVFAQGLEPNPRQVKRSLNIFLLLWSLSRNRPEITSLVLPVRLAKLVVLQQRFPELYELLPADPGILVAMEKYFRGLQAEGLPGEERLLAGDLPEPNNGMAKGTGQPEWFVRLHDLSMAERAALSGVLTMHPLPPEGTGVADDGLSFTGLEPYQITPYIFLTSSVKKTPGGAAEGPVDSRPPTLTPTPDAAAVARGEPWPIQTSLAESRRSFIEASTFGELARTKFSGRYLANREQVLNDLARAGGQFYRQVYSDPLQRKGLEADLSVNRKLTIVAPEEAQIPWELLYQGDMATEDATSPGSPAFSPAPPIEWGRFWGGQYTIARPVATPVKTEVAIAASPLYVSLGVDKDLPSAEEVQSGFRPMIGQGSVELAIVNEMNALRQSWEQNRPGMYILHGPAGVEGGESWIGLGTTEAARIDRLELYRILDRYFDSSELRDLCFDLGVDYEEIPGDTKAAKAREIISYLERRARLDELPGLIQEARPNVELSFGTSQARLTRRELRRWSVKLEGRGLLFLDVAAGLGRNSDWAGWLDMFVQMGFGGVIVPLLTPDLSWSKDFMLRFVEAFLKPEMTAGDALRAARNEFYKIDENPLGLLYAHYGRVDQGLMPLE